MPAIGSQQKTVDYLLHQMSSAGNVVAKKMFGEFGVYCDGKLVGLICGDRLFLKPTKVGRDLLGDAEEAAPYPGAKPSLVIDEERWDDGAWLSHLIKMTAVELPLPNPKSRKAR